MENFLSLNVENFISSHSHYLNNIIFTGDVFLVPSIQKWKRLKQLEKNFQIHIAPGNHDIFRLDSNDVFKLSVFNDVKLPSLIKTNNIDIVIDNSISSKWTVSNKTIKLVNNINAKKVIIARHNAPIKELSSLVNSLDGKSSNLGSIDELILKLKNKSLFWIIGDGGGFSNMPRTNCIKFKNHTFIINGIGGIDGDEIIIEKNGELFRFII